MASQHYTHKIDEITTINNSQNNNHRRSIIVDNGSGNLKIIPLSSIYYFKSRNKAVMVKSLEGEFTINKTLNSIENIVGNNFIRIHRNALVSVNHLDGLDKNQEGRWCVRFRELSEVMEISRRNTPSVLRKLREGFC